MTHAAQVVVHCYIMVHSTVANTHLSPHGYLGASEQACYAKFTRPSLPVEGLVPRLEVYLCTVRNFRVDGTLPQEQLNYSNYSSPTSVFE